LVLPLNLDTYVNEMLEEYNAYIKRDLKPKKIPMQPGLETPDPKEQNYIDHLLQITICSKLG
jgi:hypothetical protein